MRDPNLLKPILITKPAQLRSLANTLASEPLIAVDTESNSLHAYQEQVCLIQFSIPGKDYLVDPLVLDDLSPLAPIFSSPEREKIFHAAEYDLICLKRDFGFSFVNIFDTMLAARIAGIERVGLGSMLEAEFGVRLNKRHQRANWGERPLPDYLLAYARLDTHYLITLRDKLRGQLTNMNLLSLAQEDFKRACRVNDRTPTPKTELCWRIHGARDLTPQKATVLQALCLYRDRMAQKLNRPLFKVLNNHKLLALAQSCPHSNEGLLSTGLTHRQTRLFGNGILAAITQGLKAPPVYSPRRPRPGGDFVC
ncbi:MAG: ribonuclease D, partial [Anaerolineales bacterium]